VTENGYGKRTSLAEYPVKGRGAKGVLTAKLTAKKGGLAGARVVREGQELLFISQSGMVQRNAVSGISRMGRPTQGVRLMNLKKGDRVSAVALVVESDQNGNGASAAAAMIEDEAPTAATVAEDAAAAEAAGNGEAKVTRATPPEGPGGESAKPEKPKRGRSSGGSKGRGSRAKPKSPAQPKAKPKAGRRKIKPPHTATAKQRAESEAKKRRKK
jgi:DNA gyrase subunit A